MEKPLLFLIVGSVALFGFIGAIMYSGGPEQYYPSNSQVLSSNGSDVGFGNRPNYNEETIANLIHLEVNNARLANNQTELSFDNVIAGVAKQHSQDMALNDYFNHVSLEGVGPDQRGIDAGYLICGDIETRQQMESFRVRQDKNVSDKTEFNQRMLAHNAQVRAYNTDMINPNSDIRDFHPNQDLIDRQRKQQLDNNRKLLDNEATQLNAVSRQLDIEYDELITKNDRVHKGFSENLAQTGIWNSQTELAGIITYDWKTEQEIAFEIVNGWLNSPGHRENLLNTWDSSEGVGVVIQGDNLLATQNFC